MNMTTLKRSRVPSGNNFRGKLLSLGFWILSAFVVTTADDDTFTSVYELFSSFNAAYNRSSHPERNFWYAPNQPYDKELDGYKNSFLTSLLVIEVEQQEFETVLRRAKRLGFQLIRKVFDDEDFYLLRQKNQGHRFRRDLENLVLSLYSDTRIRSVVPQFAVERHRRYFSWQSSDTPDEEREELVTWNTLSAYKWMNDPQKKLEKYVSLNFNDPLYKDQWYLVNRNGTNLQARHPHDINVLPVWTAGINGSGVRICVLDDGVHMQSPEVSSNFNPFLSFDYINLRSLGPDDIPENSHGTYCAAIAAGVANNKYCGVGVAYGAQIGGPRVLDAPITDVQEAMALTQSLDYVDIYTASWGPKDNGKELAGPGPLAEMALEKGVTQGRQGLGAIYVWAAGNGGVNDDNCNADGYASSIYTLTFGAVTDTGRSTYYSEPCAAVIASTYIGGSHLPPTTENIAELKRKIKVVVPEPHGKCRETFQGTSAAAPMASGVIALVLQANPKLSWRDVNHITIECARLPTWSESGWSINAAKKHFHLKIGFGVLDAACMVDMARKWTSVEPLRRWTSKAAIKPRRIKAGSKVTISLRVLKKRKDSHSYIGCLENVFATVNITHPRRCDLELFLISPGGTVSPILTRRRHDEATHIFMWNFTSLHFWGESPFGEWNLEIIDGGTSGSGGFISYFSLTLFGTSTFCQNQEKPISNLSTKQLINLMKRDENHLRSVKLKIVN